MNLSGAFSSLQQELVRGVEGVHPSVCPSIPPVAVLGVQLWWGGSWQAQGDPARLWGILAGKGGSCQAQGHPAMQRGRRWPFHSSHSPAWKVLSRSRLPMNCKSSGCHRNSQGATQPSGSITVIFSILFALHQSTLNSLWHWCSAERFPPRSYSCAVSKPQ